MKTSLIALLFLFPPIETVSITPTHHQTEWTIRYEFKSNDRCFVSINSIDCFITGDLWDSTNHDRKVKLKNLHLFIKENDVKFTNDVCGSGNHKRFEVKIENEQRKNVGELELTSGQKFFIVVSIKHHHEPESNYDILRGYLDIRLVIGHKTFNKYIVLAQQHRILPPQIKLEPPQPYFLTKQFFRTSPDSIILSQIINDNDINSHYYTNVPNVFPGSKIKISFYYYLSAQYKSELEFYVCTYDRQGIPNEGDPIILKRKFEGWQHYEKTLTISKDMTKLGLKFDSEVGIVFIDDITMTVLGLDP